MPTTYRRIDDEICWAREIWDREEHMPRWYRDASRAWTPTYVSFLSFYVDCSQIWGLFEGERLLSCVYIQTTAPATVNVHFSVLERVTDKLLISFIESLKRTLVLEQGIERIEGWILSANWPLRWIAKACGFRETGMRCDYGQSRGRVLRWLEVRA